MRDAFGETFEVPEGYLNTASIGIPPAGAARAVVEAVRRWRGGRDDAPDFDPAVATARRAFAQLLGVPVDRVASGTSVSGLVGLVASALPDGARVLVPRREFTSVTYPFAVQAHRGVTVHEVEVAEIPERAAGFDLVAASAVQSSDGTVLDLAALREAARSGGTRVLLDVSQALGWLPLAGDTAGPHRVDWADWVVCAAYKWLLSPRGAAWLAVRPDAPELVPQHANWYAAEDPWDAVYGLPTRLAPDARALDLSPAWFAQVGAAAAMSWLAGVDRARVAEHCVGLADEFRSGLGLPPAGSAIVSVEGSSQTLAAAGVRASMRAGRVRLSFHLYNTRGDVDRALRALRGS